MKEEETWSNDFYLHCFRGTKFQTNMLKEKKLDLINLWGLMKENSKASLNT